MTRKVERTPERESYSSTLRSFSAPHSPPVTKESCLRCGPRRHLPPRRPHVPHPILHLLPKAFAPKHRLPLHRFETPRAQERFGSGNLRVTTVPRPTSLCTE